MRVLIDEAVSAEFPNLGETVAHLRPDWGLASFPAQLGSNSLYSVLVDNMPDVLVVDSKWLIIGAPILLSLLRYAEAESTRTLITVPHVDNVTKIRAAHNGFDDIVSVNVPTRDLVEKIHHVNNGDSDLDRDDLWRTIRRPTRTHADQPIAQSDIDRSIIELLRIGISDNEIAEALNLSGQTVRNRVSAMLQRDGFTNRTQLAWAYSNQVLVERSTENPLWTN